MLFPFQILRLDTFSMAKPTELQFQVPIELQETGESPGRSGEREDSDSFALRQAGKKPVLRVSLGLL